MSEAQILPGKVRGFRIRVLISRGESAEADTEPEADIGALPDWEVLGMAGIAQAVFGVVTAFHAGRHDPAPDLTLAKLEHRCLPCASPYPVAKVASGGAFPTKWRGFAGPQQFA